MAPCAARPHGHRTRWSGSVRYGRRDGRSDRQPRAAGESGSAPGESYETSGLGAAIDAAVGLGIHPSFESAVAAMTRVVETREPDPAAAALYDELYRRVYRHMYERLKPLYEEIRSITGYPG
jgi:hypothetical protein